MIQKAFLEKLGLQSQNEGTSTGLKSLSGSTQKIDSHSPVDGAFIGSVSVTTREQYDQVIQTAEAAFKE